MRKPGLALAAIGAALAIGAIGFTASDIGHHLYATRADGDTYTLTLDSDNGAITGSYSNGTTTVTTTLGNEIDIAYNQAMGKTDHFAQLKKNTGNFYNTDPITGIKSITVTCTSGGTNPTLYVGTTSNPSDNAQLIVSDTTYTYADEDLCYFKIAAANAAYIESVVIEYVCNSAGGASSSSSESSSSESSSSSAKTLVSIETAGQTTSYTVGDTFSYDGTLTAHWSDSTTTTPTPTVDSSAVDMTTPGTYAVGLSYGGLSISYNVTVNELSGDVYVLANSSSDLQAGDQIVLGAYYTSGSKNYAMMGQVVSTTRYYWMLGQEVTVTANRVVDPASEIVWTLEGSDGAWKLYNEANNVYLDSEVSGSYYNLALASSSTNTWDLDITSGALTLSSSVGVHVYFTYYSSGAIGEFCGSSYSSSTNPLAVYRKAGVSIPATSITMSQASGTVAIDDTLTLTATMLPSDTTSRVSWSSSDTSVATVSNGVVTGVAAGNAVITASCQGESGTISATCNITVTTIAVTGVTINTKPLAVSVGHTAALTATVAPSNATNKTVSWSSSDTSIATVNSSGVVTGVKAGTAIITVTTEDGSKTDTCTVTVSNVAVTGVSLDQATASTTVNNTVTLTATVAPNDATNQNVTWNTSDASVATVVDGVVTGHATGTATITVTTEDGSHTATCVVTVSAQAITADATITISESGTTDGTQVTDLSIGSEIYSSDSSLTLSSVSLTKAYQGTDEGIRLGASSSAGSITLTFGESHLITGVTVNAKSYGTDSTTIKITSGTGTSGTVSPTSTASDIYCDAFESDTVETTSLTIASNTSSKCRFNLYSITLTLGAVTPVYPTAISINDAEVAIGGNTTLKPTFTPTNTNVKNLTWSCTGDSDISVNAAGKVTVASTATAGDTATITVQAVSNEAGTAHVSDTATITVVEIAKDEWTILIYMCGSDLESGNGLATGDLQEIASVDGQPDDVNIVVEAGGASSWSSTYSSVISASKLNRFHLENKTYVQEENNSQLTYASMGLSSTLTSFVSWGMEAYPAEKTGLIFWNHGGAMMGCCYDEKKNDDNLLNSEVKKGLEDAGLSESNKLEFIGYDCCLMQVQDIAEFNSHYANYMIASEESESGYGWDYDKWVDNLFAGDATETVLTEIVNTFIDEQGTSSDQTLSWLDLSKMAAYKTAWENMASYLRSSVITSSNSSSWVSLIKGCKSYGDDDYTDNYMDFCIFDAKDFLNKVTASSTFNKGSMSTYLSACQTAFTNLIGYNKAGTAAGNSNGLCMWYNVSNDSSGIDEYYATSETNFTNWRTLCTTYYA